MNKDISYVVAVVLRKSIDSDSFLVVKRPTGDKDLGGHWGLPAATLKPGELPEDGAKRVCKEKLGCDCKPVRFIGVMFQKRNEYDVFLMDVEVNLVGDVEPEINNASSNNTVYVKQKWTDDPEDLRVSAVKGSCCSSIFLTERGLLYRNEWIDSLEGSDVVG